MSSPWPAAVADEVRSASSEEPSRGQFGHWLDMLGDVRQGLHTSTIAGFVLAGIIAGCSKPTAPPDDAAAAAHQQAQSAQQAKETARLEIDQIPPPAKSRYLAVHTRESWANPFLTVGRDSIRVRVILPDPNPGAYGTGTMLRPADARKQELDVRLGDLPNALSAVPSGAWPYGRVVALEETPVTTRADRPQVRRNIEATIQILNDLGVVVDEWTGPGGSLLR
ncbi:hypothetical protein ACPOL_6117 [Acidisarcina polymorpha]|uniref:Uncharacterized protein n=1 Tax=Acidisarcina polymorpha TaxID=2211140 RepID=A0A2Z5G8G2_9BACT|nr:hypothetical protein [Acidisarcina polymorpha]AXC15361.1 hypothetical protein ACPOL_6117 [Acidisarcina polymorpha]